MTIKTGIDNLQVIRYKFRMMDVAVIGPTFTFINGVNMIVIIINTILRPKSTL